ncbi:efflux RND transporter permease subunit [Chondrinema litorale]|uniref:efflux RND transporter permease subunit n=1 Tax=Chondrinema litorale TaxID=2994555 RepID=UPI002543DD1A|nr:efflux RND transporter permease subunit [Chondrinema litorale]UZR99148.1 efflux RND transporter permease subunit [Chondrinema litorale]
MLEKIISRPVLTLVISILLVLAGAVSMTTLPVERFPEIAPPSVSVQVYYPGGNAETVAKSVLLPIEEAINGTENMTYANSTATNSGRGRVTVYFKPGTDPNTAAVEIQNRISSVTQQIPPEVTASGIQVMKRMKGSIMTINIFSENGVYDETFLNAYTRINVRRELKRVEGLAEASILRSRDYAMRIWLDPNKLALYELTPKDVYNQILDQNFEAAPGKFGENSDELFEIVLKHEGRFDEDEEYGNLVVKADKTGSLLHLRDVARIEFGADNYTSENRLDGKPAVTIDIVQLSGANAVEIDKRVREILEEQAKVFPDGMDYEISYSVRDQIDQSMHQVVQTLFEAFFLVFLVVFIFLQSFRITFITAVSIPISLVGTFFFLSLVGVSMNVLSMFSLVLSIGIVVDNAIVVMEAIHEKMTHHKMPAKEAVKAAMSEITGAIISITIVIAAVFLPIGFMEGPVGIFYKEFAYTIIFAVLISAVNALTLGPVLTRLFFKDRGDKVRKTPGFVGKITENSVVQKVKRSRERGLEKFDDLFERTTKKYISMVKWSIHNKWLSLLGLVLVFVATGYLMSSTPSGFIPTEDDNFLIMSLRMPEGSSLHRTNEALRKADSILQVEAPVAAVNTVSGFNVVDNANSPSSGMAYIKLKDGPERGDVQKIDEVVKMLTERLLQIDGASINVYPRPTVQGFGDFDGVQVMLQDRTGGDLGEFGQMVNEFIAQVSQQTEVENAFTSFNPNYPQSKLVIDYEKAKSLGVSIKDMMFTIKSYFGRTQSGDFNRFSRQYGVFMQADIQFREQPKEFNNIFVKNDEGKMVPINTIVKLEQAFGPETLNRYNLYNAAKINVTPAKGYSTGDVINLIEELADSRLPASLSYEWTSMSLEEKNSGGESTIIFIMSIILVYFILAAQYESFWLPLAVILSIPTGIVGVFLAIKIAGIENNTYVQVGIIMLIGLLAKNAILIVEFAAQKRRAGMPVLEAVTEASALRLRSIVMTSLAFTVGLIPLMFAHGASAQGNKSVSIGTAGGMLSGIILGVLIIPVLAYIFQSLQDKFSMEFND